MAGTVLDTEDRTVIKTSKNLCPNRNFNPGLCYRPHVCFSPNSYVETLNPRVISRALGDGAFGK